MWPCKFVGISCRNNRKGCALLQAAAGNNCHQSNRTQWTRPDRCLGVGCYAPASSDCVGTPQVVEPTVSLTKSKRTASRTRSKQTQQYLLVASAGRGNKEVRN